MKFPNIPVHTIPLPEDHTGILWLSRKQPPKNNEVFNEPWMDNLDSYLLLRYWQKKGKPGYLYTWHAGVKVWHRHLDDAGTVSFVSHTLFDQL